MNRLIFACLATVEEDGIKALTLADSIRTFGGEYSDSPIWVLVPSARQQLSDTAKHKFRALEVELVPFEIESQAAGFPFAGKVIASAAAESRAQEQSSALVWMDEGSLVINEPKALQLETGKKLGCRPVDHLLIGPQYDKPLDPFWKSVFDDCGVHREVLFPMWTSTEQIKMFPYINAGMLVVRPEMGTLRLWKKTFHGMYLEPRNLDFYQSNHLYKIFIHQAVLAGCVLSTLKQMDIVELPYLVNYPLHIHD